PLSSPLCYTFSDTITNRQCFIHKGIRNCIWTETEAGTMEVRFEGTDGAVHVLHTYQLPAAVFDCDDQDPTSCNTFTQAGFIANRIVNAGGLTPLPSSITPTVTSPDVLASEGSQILAAERVKNYQWDMDSMTNPNTPDGQILHTDSVNLTG